MTDYLTESQLARHWRTSKTTIQRLRGQRRIPFMRFGDVIRYRIEDVETFEREHYHDVLVVGLKRKRA